MRDRINQNVKHREWYRPVAPAVLEERAGLYFHIDRPLPFMLFAVQVRKNKAEMIPSAVHVDGSARVQTVREQQNPRFYRLIREFEWLTGIPMVINTSFNDRGEPIVESPADALLAFRRMNLDALVLGNYLVLKR
jgi:carbamoyltransferase